MCVKASIEDLPALGMAGDGDQRMRTKPRATNRFLAEALSVLVVIFLIGVNGLAWQNMHAQTVSEQLHTHTRVVIKQWGDVFSSLKDAETGQRGFLITGKPAYLEPYRVSLDACLMHLTDLRRLSADHPAQHQRLAALALLVAARLSELKERIALRETHGLTGARQPIMTQSGNDLMNQIGALEAQAQHEEVQLLGERTAASQAHGRQVIRSIVLAGALGALALLLLFIFVNWQLGGPCSARVLFSDITKAKATLNNYRQNSIGRG